jgi:hypothetical protein
MPRDCAGGLHYGVASAGTPRKATATGRSSSIGRMIREDRPTGFIDGAFAFDRRLRTAETTLREKGGKYAG